MLTISANKLADVSSGLLSYIAYISYLDPDNGLTTNATADISFALVKTGENAKSAWISGAQVFKYGADGAVSPAQITLTANVQNIVLNKWQYRNASDVWQDYPTTGDNATITGTSLIVKPTHGIWVGDCATLRIYKITTKGGPLHLRSGTGTNYKILGKYKKGREVIVLNKTTSSWYEVTAPDGKHGYIPCCFSFRLLSIFIPLSLVFSGFLLLIYSTFDSFFLPSFL